jgi:enoyl-CoA hydratase/carnithine racemase
LKLETRNAKRVSRHHFIEDRDCARVLHLISADGTNKLTRACILELTAAVEAMADDPKPLIITGNHHFFSAGADLNEIAELTGPSALDFAKMGQALMNAIDTFPALTIAAIRGYCMGGGFDLALACDVRLAHPHAVFGHRGAALGLITGWGGTQRLPRLVGKARAVEMFVAAEKLSANRALEIGLIRAISPDTIAKALELVADAKANGQ